VAAIIAVIIVVAAAAVAVARDQHQLFQAYHRLGLLVLGVAFLMGTAGVVGTFMVWRTVLRGLGADLSFRVEIRVFFVTQLGKYAPGAVWPAVMQMEAGRAHDAGRAQMLAANLMAIVISCVVGLFVAGTTLPFYVAGALTRYWWLLVALPFLIVLLHPQSLPWLINLASRLLGRPAPQQRLRVGAELKAVGWSLASWVALGLQVGILAAKGSGKVDISIFLLGAGAMALGSTAGILAIPVPAGAGVREAVLTLMLSRAMPAGTALAVAIGSRVLLILSDVALAAIVSPMRSRGRQRD
jgi:uncharacterized membrane protein YbhN (UPF0104 family)